MNKQLVKDALLWGFLLWLFGYILGFIFFAFIPTPLMGWFIMPFGIVVTLFVLWKLVKVQTFRDFLLMAVIWTLIAIIFDYIFLLQVLHPVDGYYKLDVYIYYFLAFLIPAVYGYVKTRKIKE